MKRQLTTVFTMLLVAAWATQLQATPPRGLMQVRYGGDDCGCDAVVEEPGCGCETSCCEPCCCCPRIIPAVIHGAGCLVHGTERLLNEIFCCHRCYEPCCDMGCEMGCGCDVAPAGDGYSGFEGAPMSSRTQRAYRNWNISPNTMAANRRAKSVTMPRQVRPRKSESSVVKSKPSTKKPAKLSERTASDARPLKIDDSESTTNDELVVIRRTSYDEAPKVKSKTISDGKSRIPHNPLRD